MKLINVEKYDVSDVFSYLFNWQIVQLHLVLGRKETLNSNVRHTHQAAPRNFKHIQTLLKVISILKGRAARSQVRLVDLRDFFPALRSQIRERRVAIKRRLMESEENRKRLSQMLEVNRIKNVHRSEAVQTDRSQIRACMSK